MYMHVCMCVYLHICMYIRVSVGQATYIYIYFMMFSVLHYSLTR